MSNEYVRALQQLQAQQTHLPNEIGDQWCTPDWLYLALNELYGPFVVDLFSDGPNAKCPVFFTADDNALTQDWGAALQRGAELAGADDMEPVKCFGNPPYSIKRSGRGRRAPHVTGMQHIMRKAYEEHRKGVPSFWLVKSATSENWWPDGECSKIIHVKGRIAFDLPRWYRPDAMSSDASTAGFGASLIIFDGVSTSRAPEEYIRREELMEIGMPLAAKQHFKREAWFRQWEDL